ncbi:4'-phosphopantetheinyl transferase superfamily protein [Sphingobacterium sp. ML3W]|uniref:4'-phosphopantetheinyl transferase family protein n=1 Tax=Sphingobacterium sp. ML3W TaxID=1538644 RepID=UPI00249CD08F|nr:4'-phosphopantetheinyl transferase superfamily protein [Sphingobacterium sp. ML3W]WFA78756.1 4'-phosphopantetheinyl transferase superfamily protein [Sphingobacterium sp. ML3W]
MVNILFSQIDLIGDLDLTLYKSLLPDHIKKEVNRFRFINDQKLSLLGKLMLKYAINSSGTGDLNSFKRAANNKPYILGWKNFNISHSKDTVVFCTSSADIGIDIEAIDSLFAVDLCNFYTRNEKKIINDTNKKEQKMIEIWVRKEAFAKASGADLGNILDSVDCTPSSILYNDEQWKFVEFQVSNDFVSFFCTSGSCLEFNIQTFNPRCLL